MYHTCVVNMYFNHSTLIIQRCQIIYVYVFVLLFMFDYIFRSKHFVCWVICNSTYCYRLSSCEDISRRWMEISTIPCRLLEPRTSTARWLEDHSSGACRLAWVMCTSWIILDGNRLIGLDWIELNGIGLEWIELNWPGLKYVGSNWIGVGSIA